VQNTLRNKCNLFLDHNLVHTRCLKELHYKFQLISSA